jgi:hypothetical protein
MADHIDTAFSEMEEEMEELEEGAIANPDEKRWWATIGCNPGFALTTEVLQEIEQTISGINRFARQIHQSRIKGKVVHSGTCW